MEYTTTGSNSNTVNHLLDHIQRHEDQLWSLVADQHRLRARIEDFTLEMAERNDLADLLSRIDQSMWQYEGMTWQVMSLQVSLYLHFAELSNRDSYAGNEVSQVARGIEPPAAIPVTIPSFAYANRRVVRGRKHSCIGCNETLKQLNAMRIHRRQQIGEQPLIFPGYTQSNSRPPAAISAHEDRDSDVEIIEDASLVTDKPVAQSTAHEESDAIIENAPSTIESIDLPSVMQPLAVKSTATPSQMATIVHEGYDSARARRFPRVAEEVLANTSLVVHEDRDSDVEYIENPPVEMEPAMSLDVRDNGIELFEDPPASMEPIAAESAALPRDDESSASTAPAVVPPNGKKKYCCPGCNKAFANQCSLMRHSHVHASKSSRSRPAKAAAVSLHIQASPEERPRSFKCGLCGEDFLLKRNLYEHLHVHAFKSPLKCQQCQLKFIRYSLLYDHLRSHCGIDSPPTYGIQLD